MRDHEKSWLSKVWFRKNAKWSSKPLAGATVEVTLHIRPDGSGNIQTRLQPTGSYGNNQPVDTPDQAMEVLRALWELGQKQ